MRAKHLIVAVAVVVGVVAVAVTWHIIESRPGVSRASFYRLRVGMTRNDVEAIFGKQPDRWQDFGLNCSCGIWNDNTQIIVLFNHGKATDASLFRGDDDPAEISMSDPPPPVHVRVLQFLRLAK